MGIIIIIASVAIGLLVMLIGLPLGLDPDLCLLIGMGILFGGCFWGVCVCNGESSYTPPVATTSHTASSTTNNNFGSLNSHDFSDNEVLAFARNNYQYRKNILESCSSYPRYDISLYQIVYGICNVKKISSSKWEVTLNGNVLEPDIYATRYNERHTFSKKYTVEVSDNGYLCVSIGFSIEQALVDANRGKYNF